MSDETPGSEQQEPPAGLSMLERLMSEAIAQRLVLERLLKTSLAARAEAEQADIATLAERDFDDDLAGFADGSSSRTMQSGSAAMPP